MTAIRIYRRISYSFVGTKLLTAIIISTAPVRYPFPSRACLQLKSRLFTDCPDLPFCGVNTLFYFSVSQCTLTNDLSRSFGFDLNAVASARLYLRICEKDYLPELGCATDDDTSSFSTGSFIGSISDTGELVNEKD